MQVAPVNKSQLRVVYTEEHGLWDWSVALARWKSWQVQKVMLNSGSLVVKKNHFRPGTVAHACNPSTLGGRGGQMMRSAVRDQWNPFLLKIQQLAECGGGRLLSQLLGRLRQENHLNPGGRGCSKPRSCHWLQPRRKSETPSQKKRY